MRIWVKAGLAMGLGFLLVRTFQRQSGPSAAPAAAPVDAAPRHDTFAEALGRLIAEARERGADFVDVNAGALHRRVGGYPGPQHQMVACCAAMREALGPDDFATAEPRSGSGPSLTLRYHLV